MDTEFFNGPLKLPQEWKLGNITVSWEQALKEQQWEKLTATLEMEKIGYCALSTFHTCSL